MNSRLYVFAFFILTNFLCFSQNAVLCPAQETYIKIEDNANIPMVSDNGDGTITLTHSESYITDLFANYLIYDFYQAYPSSTGELRKYFNVAFETKDLINELKASVPPEIFLIDYIYDSTPISSDIISFLDGKKYHLTKHCSDVPEVGESCANNEVTVPTDFNLIIEFNYDATNDLILATSFGFTPCGNSFSIALKGGTVDNTLQLWNSTPGTVTETYYEDYCHYIEYKLYSMLDIGCENSNYGDLNINLDTENNIFILGRPNMIFSTDFVTFEEYSLSSIENSLEHIKLFESDAYLQISNTKNKNMSLAIFSVSGQQVLTKTPYQDHQIKIDNLTSGLYFIKITNLNNQPKVFKFLKR